MAFYTRFGIAPSARAWHATKAREDGGEVWRRYLEGWVSTEPGSGREGPGVRRVRGWPAPGHVARAFGSMSRFRAAVQAELARRRRAGDPYKPVAPAQHHLDDARRRAGGPGPPDELVSQTADVAFGPVERTDPQLPARPAVAERTECRRRPRPRLDRPPRGAGLEDEAVGRDRT